MCVKQYMRFYEFILSMYMTYNKVINLWYNIVKTDFFVHNLPISQWLFRTVYGNNS